MNSVQKLMERHANMDMVKSLFKIVERMIDSFPEDVFIVNNPSLQVEE
jgi:hypothetical protein